MNKYIATYYIALVGIISFQVIATLFQGSVSVHQGYHLAELQKEQKQLKLEKNQLETKLTQAVSLHSVMNSESLTAYQPINQTVAITITDTTKTAATF